jgi:hypothetical protein
MNIIRIILILFVAVLASCQFAHAQEPPKCPENLICLSREAAQAAIAAGDKAKALEIENKAQAKAIDDLKQLLNDMKVNYAAAAAEASILKQQQVRDSAMLELMLKLVRPKRVGINIF